MSENKNLILAFVISLVILLGYDLLFMRPKMEAERARQVAQSEVAATPPAAAVGDLPSVRETATPASREDVIKQAPRIAIRSAKLTGSVSLVGGRIDDLVLTDYRTSLQKGASAVTLLSPVGSADAYFVDVGWAVAPGSGIDVPTADTVWSSSDTVLTPGKPVTLTWQSPQGVTFTRTIAVDDNYLFTVTQGVDNGSDKTLSMAPFALASRRGAPAGKATYILHEGPIGVFGETLVEKSYGEIEEEGRFTQQGAGGWLGMTDKYWLTALIPDQGHAYEGRFAFVGDNGAKRYQVDYRLDARAIAPGQSSEVTSRIFAGAKVVSLLDDYEQKLGISRFDRGVDWGWFYWFTKPIFYTLHYFHNVMGNFGLAIMALTVLLKLAFFPLANKSYVAMNKMKQLQPKMQALKERCGDDKLRLQQEMMELYKKEQVNPMAGCLPILLQIPVFFALYKVLFVTLEMRHAPFYGWVHDLSAPDPLTVVNLFGLIPWDPPQLLAIGIWPILMGITMYIQQRLNPTPPDPIQAKVMMFLPLIFTFMLASFPVGLVIYWTWNNLLSILQQWVIMKRMAAAPA
ncbi:MAG: membrane protein insertase YidC [Sphingomonadales bacterium]|nr:membrane protein insertase YidC [Sphingomonadales bacterium]